MLGQTISHYRILQKLGGGGMGVVYEAQDLRLGRHIALKFLPDELSNSHQALERFQREARSASALNHPNICTIHEIGEADGQWFIVMELLEGQTLKDRITAGAMGIEQLLEVGVQIAGALDTAHSQGIVHRDLKPSNIFLTKQAQAKILDFGVAKLVLERQRITETVGASTTTLAKAEQNLTSAGVALGTVAYMSPEQVRGLKLDAQTDLFSLGVVLYQMATATLPFRGDTPGLIFEAILTRVPNSPARLNPDVPEELERIISKALEKDRAFRYHCADDLRTDLRRLQRHSSGSGVAVVAASQKPRGAGRRGLYATVVALSVLIAITGAWWVHWHAGRSRPELPQIMPMTSYVGQPKTPAFSPDGNEIAFVWDGGRGGATDIYVKLVGEPTALRVTTAPGPKAGPVWSSDGRYIAFLRSGKDAGIFKAPALGGQERKLTDLQSPMSGLRPAARQFDWSPDGKQLVVADRITPEGPRSLFLVSVDSGERRRLTSPPQGGEDFVPTFSPDGGTIAFGRANHIFVENIHLVPTTGGEPRQLTFLENAFLDDGISWMPDGKAIVFSSVEGPSRGSLWRVSVNGGRPERMLVGLGVQNAVEPAVSRKGNRMVYTQVSTNVNIRRIELPSADRIHQSSKLIYSTRYQDGPQYSPDGKKIVFVSDRSGSNEIWVCSNDGSSPAQLTSFGAQDTGTPRWSPDGNRIVFDSLKSGNEGLYVMNADGSGLRSLVVDSHTNAVASWSRDDRWIYFGSDRTGNNQVWKVLAAGGQPVQVTKHGGFAAVESPDRKFLYYTKSFYGAPGLWRVPIEGGEEAPVIEEFRPEDWGAWAVVKKGIYFIDSHRPVAMLKFFSFATHRISQVMALEKPPALQGNPVLAVSPDEQSILYTEVDDLKSDIMLVENFR